MKNFHLNREDVVFTFIDIQDKLLKAMYNKEEIVKNATVLAKVANIIGAEAIYTVQYPKGLGYTNEEVKAPLKDKEEFPKLTFNSYGDENIKKEFDSLGKKQVILCGMESHICVFQTVRSLIEAGYEVFVAEDALGSRTEKNSKNGIELLREMGAVISNTETILFDLAGIAGTDEFKSIQKLIIWDFIGVSQRGDSFFDFKLWYNYFGDKMKIIHTADLHLKKFYKGSLPLEISNILLEDAWKALGEVFDFSNEVDADLILIAGDLFEREFFNLSDLNRFLDLVKNSSAKVFLVFGNHDYLSKDNLFLKVDLPENLYIFRNELDYFEISDLKTRIYGISYDNFSFKKDFKDLNLDKDFINIGLFHSDLKDERYLPLAESFLKQFNYVALGHIHKREKVFENTYYAGSLLPLSFKDKGKRGIIYLDDEKKSIEFKNFSKREFINLDINLKNDMEYSEILKMIQEKIDENNLYRISLLGHSRHPDDLENFLKENISAFYFEIINNIREDDVNNEIEDKYLLEVLDSFSKDNSLEIQARELTKKYILEQYYDIWRIRTFKFC